ncbi:MAG TPA: NYN domain-containing protein, partial [Micromonosporaceae bacterium]
MSERGTTDQVAVYIDFDNIVMSRYDELHGRHSYRNDDANRDGPAADVAAKLKAAEVNLAAIIDYAASFGTVSVARAYADWSTPVNKSYATATMEKSIDLVQMFPLAGTKNGADIRLAIDVIDDLSRYSYLSHVLIVAGDSDYVSLAQRCKRLGRTVIGVGATGSISRYWRAACDEFRNYDQLPGLAPPPAARKAAATKKTAAKKTAAKATAGGDSETKQRKEGDGEVDSRDAPEINASSDLLRRAMTYALEKSTDGWTNASGLKSLMKRLDPAFDEKLEGHKT